MALKRRITDISGGAELEDAETLNSNMNVTPTAPPPKINTVKIVDKVKNFKNVTMTELENDSKGLRDAIAAKNWPGVAGFASLKKVSTPKGTPKAQRIINSSWNKLISDAKAALADARKTGAIEKSTKGLAKLYERNYSKLSNEKKAEYGSLQKYIDAKRADIVEKSAKAKEKKKLLKATASRGARAYVRSGLRLSPAAVTAIATANNVSISRNARWLITSGAIEAEILDIAVSMAKGMTDQTITEGVLSMATAQVAEKVTTLGEERSTALSSATKSDKFFKITSATARKRKQKLGV